MMTRQEHRRAMRAMRKRLSNTIVSSFIVRGYRLDELLAQGLAGDKESLYAAAASINWLNQTQNIKTVCVACPADVDIPSALFVLYPKDTPSHSLVSPICDRCAEFDDAVLHQKGYEAVGIKQLATINPANYHESGGRA